MIAEKLGYKMNLFARILISLLILITINNCAYRQQSKIYPFPAANVYVKGDKIYSGDSLFAELRYLQDKRMSQDKVYAGLAIYYQPFAKEKWIFPEEGWSLKKERVEYSTIPEIGKFWNGSVYSLYLGGKKFNQEFMKTIWGVQISPDGKYVSYKTKGLFWDSSHRYSVECGSPK